MEQEILEPDVTPAVLEEEPIAQESAEECASPEVLPEEAFPPEETTAEVTSPAPKGLKKWVRKWWFWAIIAAVILCVALMISSAKDSRSSSSSSGGGSISSPATYVNPFIEIVKTTRNSKYGITYGAAFNNFFSSPRWTYFSASTGENVVEFEGDFLYDGRRATATIQFVVDLSAGTLEVYHLSINGVGQNQLMLATLVQKVFESY